MPPSSRTTAADRASPTSVAMKDEELDNITPLSGMNGHGHSTAPLLSSGTKATTTSTAKSSPTKAKFSSSNEEPITMSPDALKSVLQVQFTEAQDITTVNSGLSGASSADITDQHLMDNNNNNSLLQSFFCQPWDVNYSTSSLTRNPDMTMAMALSNSQALLSLYWMGLAVLGDFLQTLLLQRPLDLCSPFILHRMISLMWNRGPNQRSSIQNSGNNSDEQQQSASLFQLPPSLSTTGFHGRPLTRPPSVRGIPNYGQTCFLNVILQSMASLDSVIAYTEWIDMEQQQQENAAPPPRHGRFLKKQAPTTTVSQMLLPMLRSLNGQIDTAPRHLDPRELLWRIAQKNTQFQAQRHGLFGFSSPAQATGEQQDAQELLQALLEMMICDAKLELTNDNNSNNNATTTTESHSTDNSNKPLIKTPSQRSGMSLSSMHNILLSPEEKKDDCWDNGDNYYDDEVLTVLSDKWSPRNSSNNSLCGDEGNNQAAAPIQENQTVGTGTLSSSTTAWNHVQMVDSTGMLATYEDNTNNNKRERKSSADNNNPTSLASSFLSTTSTVVTANSKDANTQQLQQQQQANNNSFPTPLSASMQIMLSTISSITKTPLSCWTGSLVQCQACRHNRAVRNQEWRDIPVVPTALRNPALMMSSSSSQLPPCQLQECLANFTQVERVADVECGNCSLQRDVKHWQEEVDLLRGAVESLERRQKKDAPNGNSNGDGGVVMDQGELLRLEMEEAEAKVRILLQQDPDDYDPRTMHIHGNDDDDSGVPSKMLRADALKCLVLTRLPSVLCLHVQRRYYDPATDRMSKTLQHVVFDEFIDLAPYSAYGGANANAQSFFNAAANNNNGTSSTSSPPEHQHTSPIWYRLASVVEHKGNAFGGHYVCYRRLPAHLSTNTNNGLDDKTQWYYCSDEAIHMVGWEQVQRAQAYMLFYEAM